MTLLNSVFRPLGLTIFEAFDSRSCRLRGLRTVPQPVNEGNATDVPTTQDMPGIAVLVFVRVWAARAC